MECSKNKIETSKEKDKKKKPATLFMLTTLVGVNKTNRTKMLVAHQMQYHNKHTALQQINASKKKKQQSTNRQNNNNNDRQEKKQMSTAINQIELLTKKKKNLARSFSYGTKLDHNVKKKIQKEIWTHRS